MTAAIGIDVSTQGVPVGSVPLGGSAQQHGTVYTAADGSLTRRLSPIWMDTSARKEAEELERHFGGEMLRRTGSTAPDVKVRAVVEGQVANLYERTRWAGEFTCIILAGGASRSDGIRRTVERIFGAETSVADVADAAALGAARIAQRNTSC